MLSGYNLHSLKAANAAKKAMLELIDNVNIMGEDKALSEGVAAALIGSHPTLVASFFRVFVMACEDADLQNKLSDPRSQSCLPLVKMIDEWSKENGIPFI